MITLALVFLTSAPQAGFVQDQETFRRTREAALMAPRGWLSVAGLLWLHEGSQTLGSAGDADLKLPRPAPATVGMVTMKGDSVSLALEPGVTATVNGGPVPATLKSDAQGGPDLLLIEDLTLGLIKRGERTGFRLWNPNTTNRRNFTGCHWFAADPAMVVKARFVPHKEGQTIPITNVLGDTAPQPNPGYVEFRLLGQACRLEAVAEGSGLFFNFKDATSGRECYAAGRFLNTDSAKDGYVTLDFNQSVNPPCAYTDFATCPLPPKGNTLKVRIAAGEKSFHNGK